MKNIFKISFLFAIMALSYAPSQAQLRTKTVQAVNKGYNIVLGQVPNVVNAGVLADTLGVSDTIAYVIPVVGPNRYLPFLSIGWAKIGSGTATITAAFYEGNTATNCSNAIKYGSANGTYTKTLTYSASTTTPTFIDFLADSAKVSGQYLRIVYTTSSTASVQGSILTNVSTTNQ